jgi:hypothetical protein
VVKSSDKETKKTKSVLPENSKSETKAKEMNHMLSKATITAHYHNALIVSCIAYDRMVRTRKCHRLGCRKEGLTKEDFLTAKATICTACHSMESKKKNICNVIGFFGTQILPRQNVCSITGSIIIKLVQPQSSQLIHVIQNSITSDDH